VVYGADPFDHDRSTRHRARQAGGAVILPRRRLLLATLGAVAAPAIVRAQAPAKRDPFTLGIASGYPRPDRVVLWTRLAPEPLEGGGMPPGPAEVSWEIAADEGFRSVVARGRVTTTEAVAHSVHVEATGLQPARWYWYRFTAGDVQSPVGRTRTAPAAGARHERLRLATASCAQYEQGYFSAYRHMAAEELDLVVHLGDYIYELSWGRSHVRKHTGGIPTALWEFRDRHALYRSDRDLQAAHAACPWMMIWDDHEVADDHTATYAPRITDTAQFLKVRQAAYQAWFEHMPVPPSMAPTADGMTIYGRHAFGDLAEILLLDDRQHRSAHACVASRSSSRTTADCPDRDDPGRTMLGQAQEAWLDGAVRGARGRWTLFAQQTPMAEVIGGTAERPTWWMDGWDGYPAARQRVLDGIARHKPGGPLVLGGDVHSFWVNDLPQRFGEDRAPAIATELVCSSITSDGPRPDRLHRAMVRHPYVKHADGQHRGWLDLELTPKQATARLRAVSDVREPLATVSTLGTWAVDQEKPGAERA
jgi:alkaline phosphatase D